MQTQLRTHNFGLHIIAHHRYNGVNHSQLDAHHGIAQGKGDHCPGDHDTAGSQNRQNIHHRNTGCFCKGALDAEN